MAAPSSEIVGNEPVPDDGNIIADEDDSTMGSEYGSDTTSVKSAIHKGYIENGRRYARQKEYWGPSDEKQFEVMETGHLTNTILDSQQKNPFFRSPISEKAQNVLDVGTGQGNWAIDVAQEFPNLIVRGVDLYPPPQTWVPPNCIFEVDNVVERWTWKERFDLIHIRQFMGALSTAQIDEFYKQAYDNLVPGGWIEQVEFDIQVKSMNGAMPADSLLSTWHEFWRPIEEKTDHPINIQRTMRGRIEAAGFQNIHEKEYNCPIGQWPKHRVYKDAGTTNMMTWKNGTEGWSMYLLTKYGLPEPWSPEQVHAWLANVRAELDQPWNLYQGLRRVWAQKPLDAK